METWTPQDWVVFIGAMAAAIVTVLGALGAGAKYYIDYLGKDHDDKIKALEAKVKQLEHDRKRDRRRIVQLVQVLRDNNIPVPLEVADDFAEDD